MKELMICTFKDCKKYLLDPIILPCSNNVCKCHLDELVKNGETSFMCMGCAAEHTIPKSGFIANSFASRLIQLNLHMNENEKILAASLVKLKESIRSFETIVNDPAEFIYDFIFQTQIKIDLERERLINEINYLSDGMLKKLRNYKERCMNNLTSLKDSNVYYKAYLAEISKDLFDMKEKLRMPSIDMTTIDELLKRSKELTQEIKEKCFDYKKNLMQNKKCYFSKENIKLDQKLVGKLNISYYINSSILDHKHFVELIKLCGFDALSHFQLIYQASRDGFSSQVFHSKCDGIPNTLAIIKAKESLNIFGGFCKETWDKYSSYKYDSNAFIFSLKNNDNEPFKICVTDPSKAIYCGSGRCLTYGGGHDIYISDNSNLNKNSYSSLGQSYKSNLFFSHSLNVQLDLAGSYNFTTQEIEVYKVS